MYALIFYKVDSNSSIRQTFQRNSLQITAIQIEYKFFSALSNHGTLTEFDEQRNVLFQPRRHYIPAEQVGYHRTRQTKRQVFRVNKDKNSQYLERDR